MRGGAAATLLALAALGGAERREPPSFSEFMHASLSIAQLRELDALMGWSSLSDAARVKHFRACDERSAEGEALAASGRCPSLGSAASMLELGAAKPWRSRYAFQSKLLTEDQMSDAITRVQRWDGLTLDPQAAWRSGYLNASGYYEAPYILGYTGPTHAIGGRPSDTATAAATAVATATAGTATATSGAGTDGDGETSAAIAGPGDTDTASATASAVATASATAADTATDGSTDTASATATVRDRGRDLSRSHEFVLRARSRRARSRAQTSDSPRPRRRRRPPTATQPQRPPTPNRITMQRRTTPRPAAPGRRPPRTAGIPPAPSSWVTGRSLIPTRRRMSLRPWATRVR